jgi:hypothetical protein
MSTRNISWEVKAAGALGLLHTGADFLEIWEPQSSENIRACPGLNTEFFTKTFDVKEFCRLSTDSIYVIVWFSELKAFISLYNIN